MKALHAIVTGRVQMVGYRQACRIAARSLGLSGWVRNRADGTVEVWAQGPDAALDDFVPHLWRGSTAAEVVGVESEMVAPDTTLRDFFIMPDERLRP